jgi:hypothetical protein
MISNQNFVNTLQWLMPILRIAIQLFSYTIDWCLLPLWLPFTTINLHLLFELW